MALPSEPSTGDVPEAVWSPPGSPWNRRPAAAGGQPGVWHRVAHSWLPEAVAVLLFALTVIAGPPVGRALHDMATSLRNAEVMALPNQRAWLDIAGTSDPWQQGLTVEWVDPHGASAGILRPGDVIMGVDGQVVGPAGLQPLMGKDPAGTVLHLMVDRGTRYVHLDVRLASQPPHYSEPGPLP